MFAARLTDDRGQLGSSHGCEKIARLTGWLMVVTFVTSIPAYFIFYAPVRNHPDYVTGVSAEPQPRAWLWARSSSSS